MVFKGLMLSKTGKISGRLGIEIEEGKGISAQEILYYGLSGFEEPAALTPFILSVYSLLFPNRLYIPFYHGLNQETRRLYGFLCKLREKELIRSVPLEETIEERLVYRYLREITRESGEEWRKTKKRIEELSESLGVDKNKISTYTSIPEKRVKAIFSGGIFPTNSEVDELEKFFGKRIIYRWKKINKNNAPRIVSILNRYQEKIIEGLENNSKGEALVQRYNLKPQTEFVFRSKSPWEVLEESMLTIHVILSYATVPMHYSDIERGLGLSFRTGRILLDYGILNRDDGKYYTSSGEIWNYCVKRLFRQTEKFKLYIKAKKLKDMGMSPSEISKRLNLSVNTIKCWLYRGEKPTPLPSYAIELLRKWEIGDREIEDFKKYELIR